MNTRQLTPAELAEIYPRKADRFPPLTPPDDNRGYRMLGWLLWCDAVLLTAGMVIWIFWAMVS